MRDGRLSWPWCLLYTKIIHLSADSHPSKWNHLIVTQPGVEPTTSWSQVRHATVMSASHLGKCSEEMQNTNCFLLAAKSEPTWSILHPTCAANANRTSTAGNMTWYIPDYTIVTLAASQLLHVLVKPFDPKSLLSLVILRPQKWTCQVAACESVEQGAPCDRWQKHKLRYGEICSYRWNHQH